MFTEIHKWQKQLGNKYVSFCKTSKFTSEIYSLQVSQVIGFDA